MGTVVPYHTPTALVLVPLVLVPTPLPHPYHTPTTPYHTPTTPLPHPYHTLPHPTTPLVVTPTTSPLLPQTSQATVTVFPAMRPLTGSAETTFTPRQGQQVASIIPTHTITQSPTSPSTPTFTPT